MCYTHVLFNNVIAINSSIIFLFNAIDMASAAFIEALPVIEFVAQLLGKDVLTKTLSDSDRVKVDCYMF